MCTKLAWSDLQLGMNMYWPWLQSEFLPTSSIRFSLTTKVFEEFLDNLETCNMYYNPSLKWNLKLQVELCEKWPRRWVKILPKLGQNFSKLKVLGTLVPKIITWDTSLFWENFVNQSCRLCDGLQLSCCKFCLNPFASWWKNGTKLGKNKEVS